MRKLPRFKTKEEETNFWKKHSIAEYWEDLEESDDTFKRPKLTPVTLKFDPLLKKKLKMLARKRGDPTTLIYASCSPKARKKKCYLKTGEKAARSNSRKGFTWKLLDLLK